MRSRRGRPQSSIGRHSPAHHRHDRRTKRGLEQFADYGPDREADEPCHAVGYRNFRGRLCRVAAVDLETGKNSTRARRPPQPLTGPLADERKVTKMLSAVIGSSAGKTRDEIMAIYPRHKAFLDQFIARGEVVGVGPFTDAAGGNMALFRSRAAAEAFAKSDPFFLEGVVKDYQIKDWGDKLLS